MEFRNEAMRIGGQRVHRDRVIEVLNPYTGACVGTVPSAGVYTSVPASAPVPTPATVASSCVALSAVP